MRSRRCRTARSSRSAKPAANSPARRDPQAPSGGPPTRPVAMQEGDHAPAEDDRRGDVGAPAHHVAVGVAVPRLVADGDERAPPPPQKLTLDQRVRQLDRRGKPRIAAAGVLRVGEVERPRPRACRRPTRLSTTRSSGSAAATSAGARGRRSRSPGRPPPAAGVRRGRAPCAASACSSARDELAGEPCSSAAARVPPAPARGRRRAPPQRAATSSQASASAWAETSSPPSGRSERASPTRVRSEVTRRGAATARRADRRGRPRRAADLEQVGRPSRLLARRRW